MGHRRYFDGKPEYGSPPKTFTENDILHQVQDVHCGKFGKNNNNLDRKGNVLLVN